MVKKWKDLWTRSMLPSLGLGQLLSLLLTSTRFTSSQLVNQGIYAPFSLSFLNYILLTLIYGGIMLCRRQKAKARAKAYGDTSVKSITLLNYWTILCVLLFSWFYLKRKYRFQKMVGVAICVAGFVTFVYTNIHSAYRSSDNNPLIYDYFIIFGATVYGVNNITQEFLVKKDDRIEVLAFLGIIGSLSSGYEIALYEQDELKSIYSSSLLGAIFSLIGLSFAMFLFYSGVSLLLKINGSTMLNLSLLTSDMWVVLIRIFAYHEKVHWMYFVAFASVALGLIIYSSGDKMDSDNGETECKHFDEEANLGYLNNVGISNSDVISTKFVEKGNIVIMSETQGMTY